jgi:hypothetical protein
VSPNPERESPTLPGGSARPVFPPLHASTPVAGQTIKTTEQKFDNPRWFGIGLWEGVQNSYIIRKSPAQGRTSPIDAISVFLGMSLCGDANNMKVVRGYKIGRIRR